MLNKPKLFAAGAVCALSLTSSQPAKAQATEDQWLHKNIHHVLLISIDGMHGVDYINCAKGLSAINNGESYCPNLAALGRSGVNYPNAYTSKPSDSFPGLTAIMTAGMPRSTGVYYDVAYDRALDAPAKTTGNGVAAGSCVSGADPTGTRTEYEEGIDIDQTKLNGGAPGAGLTDGGVNSIDPKRLVRDPKNNCAPVYPWDFVRTNSIFSVIHAAHGYTAWSDKHPAYISVAGHGSGGATVDDFYAPEINSTVVPLPGVVTPTGLACSAVPDPSQTGSWTDSFANIKCYDTIKVNAILNQINGKTHDGKAAQVPQFFGMNFQAVSVGQKLIESGVGTGGYLDGQGTPSQLLLAEIQFADKSIGEMMSAIKKQGLEESTLIVITAKHGQSPIDPKRYLPVPGHSGTNGESPATIIAGLLPYSESPNNPTGIGPTEDDVSLLWLADSRNTTEAVNELEDNAKEAAIGEILYGNLLAKQFNTPGLGPNLDSRTPDIIVIPNIGVTYTGSKAKQSEHGGFAPDDTNVMLLLSNPGIIGRTVPSDVDVTQIAPTILSALGLNPTDLDAVREEGSTALPHFYFDIK